MNEKIRELAINSQLVSEYKGELISGWQEGVDLTEYLEKFAELIVRECDLYARQNWEHGLLLGGDLKRYFGVEE